jgi:cytochrome c nitrite reductase small subunit
MRLTMLNLVLLILIGAIAGIGSYAFIYAKGYSYLLNDPSACANCHVMNDQYNGWLKSSHHSVATCNDCHTPHNLVGKYAVKATDGLFHSFYFTTGTYPDTIEISGLGHKVVEAACRNCHSAVTQAIDAQNVHANAEGVECTRCHLSVGHLENAASLRNAPMSEDPMIRNSAIMQLSDIMPSFRSNHDQR